MHHIKDSHQWHIATIGHTHITLPLPVIIYEKGHGLRLHMSSAFYWTSITNLWRSMAISSTRTIKSVMLETARIRKQHMEIMIVVPWPGLYFMIYPSQKTWPPCSSVLCSFSLYLLALPGGIKCILMALRREHNQFSSQS